MNYYGCIQFILCCAERNKLETVW